MLPPQKTDQKTGTIRIIVDGREVARFERDGLHVRQDVDYGGLLKDNGQQSYDKPAKAEPTALLWLSRPLHINRLRGRAGGDKTLPFCPSRRLPIP